MTGPSEAGEVDGCQDVESPPCYLRSGLRRSHQSRLVLPVYPLLWGFAGTQSRAQQ
jgi:hypothetical protein